LKPLPKYKIIESEKKTTAQQKFLNRWLEGQPLVTEENL